MENQIVGIPTGFFMTAFSLITIAVIVRLFFYVGRSGITVNRERLALGAIVFWSILYLAVGGFAYARGWFIPWTGWVTISAFFATICSGCGLVIGGIFLIALE